MFSCARAPTQCWPVRCEFRTKQDERINAQQLAYSARLHFECGFVSAALNAWLMYSIERFLSFAMWYSHYFEALPKSLAHPFECLQPPGFNFSSKESVPVFYMYIWMPSVVTNHYRFNPISRHLQWLRTFLLSVGSASIDSRLNIFTVSCVCYVHACLTKLHQTHADHGAGAMGSHGM